MEKSAVDIASLTRSLLAGYLEHFPEERKRQAILESRLLDPTGLVDRSDMRGHLTASAFVYCPAEESVLLIHHASLDKWLQPGGHLDAGETPLAGARREAEEEVGLPAGATALVIDGGRPLLPFDIDTHLIPARPSRGETAHYHFDFRYAFLTETTDWVRRDERETLGFRWLPPAAVRPLGVPEDLARTVDKLVGMLARLPVAE